MTFYYVGDVHKCTICGQDVALAGGGYFPRHKGLSGLMCRGGDMHGSENAQARQKHPEWAAEENLFGRMGVLIDERVAAAIAKIRLTCVSCGESAEQPDHGGTDPEKPAVQP
jgi:hypothetical protein